MDHTFCAHCRCVELVDDDISEYCIMHQPDVRVGGRAMPKFHRPPLRRGGETLRDIWRYWYSLSDESQHIYEKKYVVETGKEPYEGYEVDGWTRGFRLTADFGRWLEEVGH